MPVVLITGASRGLGRAMVDRFAEAGWTIAGCGRSPETIQNLSGRYAAPHLFKSVDVTQEIQVASWARAVLDTLGPPDLLLNNAGVINRNAPLWEVSSQEFSEVLDVNLRGIHHVIRHFVPAMVEKSRGVIVNFSSGWGRSTSAEVAPYCASKWGVEGLSQALAQELPRGMASIALNPGIIDTEMLRSCFGEGAGNYPDPQDWSRRAVPFLMKLSSRQNGEALTVPGG